MSAAPPGSAHRWMKDGAQVKLAQTKIPRVGIVSHLHSLKVTMRHNPLFRATNPSQRRYRAIR